jgi:hypothetical protein
MGDVIQFAPRVACAPAWTKPAERLAYRCHCGSTDFQVFMTSEIECTACGAAPVCPEKGLIEAHFPEEITLTG